MKKYKNLIIVLVLICGAFLGWRYHQEQKLLNLHHTYEVSLAKALKNSYQDIEEIHFDNPYYSDKPGGWYVDVTLEFKDGTEIEYRTSHSFSSKTNYSASIGGKEGSKMMDELALRSGKTFSRVKVYYSSKKEEER